MRNSTLSVMMLFTGCAAGVPGVFSASVGVVYTKYMHARSLPKLGSLAMRAWNVYVDLSLSLSCVPRSMLAKFCLVKLSFCACVCCAVARRACIIITQRTHTHTLLIVMHGRKSIIARCVLRGYSISQSLEFYIPCIPV